MWKLACFCTGLQACNACVVYCPLLVAGGRALFTGTQTGGLRAYKFPLSGEYQEFKCCTAPITQLRLNSDDSVLFASGEDGSLFVFDVKDRDPARGAGKR